MRIPGPSAGAGERGVATGHLDAPSVCHPRHLATLRLVLELGSFSAAARSLGYSTSAVSQQIAALERDLGTPLFDRTSQRIIPNDAGLQMARLAADILTHIEQAVATMQGYVGGTRGRVRVAAFAGAGAHLLPPVLARFAQDLPDVDVDLRVVPGEGEQLGQIVADGDADVAVDCSYRLAPTTWPDTLHVRRLLTEEMVVITAADHHLTQSEEPTLASLSADAWVSDDPGSLDAANLVAACAAAGFEPDVRFRTGDHDLMRGIVRTGSAVALIPPLALGNDRTIPLTRLADDAPTRDVVVLSRIEDDEQPMVQTALTSLTEAARQFVTWSSAAFAETVTAPLAYAP